MNSYSSKLLNFVTRGPVIAMELMGEGAVSKWRDLIGPTDCAVARQDAPTSLRARFGKGKTDADKHQANMSVQ